MSLHTGLVFIFTILASVSIVAAIILLGKQAPAENVLATWWNANCNTLTYHST